MCLVCYCSTVASVIGIFGIAVRTTADVLIFHIAGASVSTSSTTATVTTAIPGSLPDTGVGANIRLKWS